jgi:hypothetical protein
MGQSAGGDTRFRFAFGRVHPLRADLLRWIIGRARAGKRVIGADRRTGFRPSAEFGGANK